ncbi:MAG: DNA polymerase sliding clamp [Candidatus Methanomethylophilus sp.]|nr:DNA polymerase sliding clamp [Methanomethylophilus sp.]
MFNAEMKSETFKNIIHIIATVVDEVKMSIHPDSLTMKAIDPSHVAMIDLMVEKDAFISYEADDTEIGLDLDKIKSVLKLAGPGDTIRMSHNPDQGMLTVTIGNIERRMGLVDTGSLSDPKVPKVDLAVSVKVPLDQLQKGIRAAESISDVDHIKIEVNPDGFELSCAGDTDLASLRVPASELEISAEDSAHSMYPLDYFSNIVKVIPSESVEVQLDTDYPVKLLFDIAEGHAHITYLLAPRIENE